MRMTPHCIINAKTSEQLPAAQQLADRYGIPLGEPDQAPILLSLDEMGLALQVRDQPKVSALRVDFVSGQAQHRRLYGGGKGQLIAKAVGLHKYSSPRVLDVTAGLGRDAFVLATLGCQVMMIERSPIIAALLDDGLTRMRAAPELSSLPLSLQHADALLVLENLAEQDYPDVIYLDPMFPERIKSAAVKKEMMMLRAAVGDDQDAHALWQLALTRAKKRVVVKRSKLAPTFAGREPTLVLRGKSSRYDIYVVT